MEPCNDGGVEAVKRGGFKKWRRKWGWILIGSMFAIAAILGGWGLWENCHSKGYSLGDVFYGIVQLFWMNSSTATGEFGGWQLEVAQGLAALLFLLIVGSAVWQFFHEQISRARAMCRHRHAVVAGVSPGGLRFICGLLREECRWPHKVTLIAPDRSDPLVARALDEGALVLYGSPTDKTQLRQAAVARANVFVALSGNDSLNHASAQAAAEIAAQKGNRHIRVRAHIASRSLIDLLRCGPAADSDSSLVPVELFNSHETSAVAMITTTPPWDPERGMENGCAPWVVIVGLGDTGQNLLALLARWWWGFHAKFGKLRVTALDPHATRRVAVLQTLYPWIGELCEVIPFDADVESDEFLRGNFLRAPAHGGEADATRVPAVAYLCTDNDESGLFASVTLARLPGMDNLRICTCFTNATMVEAVAASPYRARVMPVQVPERCYMSDLVLNADVELMARLAHLFYTSAEMAKGNKMGSTYSLEPWEKLHHDAQAQNRSQAEHIDVKLHAIGCRRVPLAGEWVPTGIPFTDAEVEHLMVMEHDRWSELMRELGWSYADIPKKDRELKRHPDMKPFEELDVEGKEKDRDTIHNMPMLLAAAGWRIVRDA